MPLFPSGNINNSRNVNSHDNNKCDNNKSDNINSNDKSNVNNKNINSLFGNSFIDERPQDVDVVVRVFCEHVGRVWTEIDQLVCREDAREAVGRHVPQETLATNGERGNWG